MSYRCGPGFVILGYRCIVSNLRASLAAVNAIHVLAQSELALFARFYLLSNNTNHVNVLRWQLRVGAVIGNS